MPGRAGSLVGVSRLLDELYGLLLELGACTPRGVPWCPPVGSVDALISFYAEQAQAQTNFAFTFEYPWKPFLGITTGTTRMALTGGVGRLRLQRGLLQQRPEVALECGLDLAHQLGVETALSRAGAQEQCVAEVHTHLCGHAGPVTTAPVTVGLTTGGGTTTAGGTVTSSPPPASSQQGGGGQSVPPERGSGFHVVSLG